MDPLKSSVKHITDSLDVQPVTDPDDEPFAYPDIEPIVDPMDVELVTDPIDAEPVIDCMDTSARWETPGLCRTCIHTKQQ